MFTQRILARGPASLAAIEVGVSGREWAGTPEYDALVDLAWRERMAQSAHTLWDGTYYRVLNLDEWETSAGRCAMRLGMIRYRYIATFRALHEHHARCGLEPLYHLSTVALIRTCDGYFLFGRRARNGAIDLIGGGVQQDEMPIVGGMDIEQNLYKEIREEAGIGASDAGRIGGIGALLSTTSNVLLVGSVRCGLSRAEVEARFAEREDAEMAEAVFVPERELATFLEGMTDYRRLIPELLEGRLSKEQ